MCPVKKKKERLLLPVKPGEGLFGIIRKFLTSRNTPDK
jgi:hypothetical protein